MLTAATISAPGMTPNCPPSFSIRRQNQGNDWGFFNCCRMILADRHPSDVVATALQALGIEFDTDIVGVFLRSPGARARRLLRDVGCADQKISLSGSDTLDIRGYGLLDMGSSGANGYLLLL
jgi:hypothetical protein